MDYKFKTFYKGCLMECDIETADGLVIIDGPVGYFRESPDRGDAPLLEVFQSTGRVSQNGLMYRGHIIETPTFQWPATIIWHQLQAGFILDFGAEFVKERYAQFDLHNFRAEECRIVGHIALEGKN